jgi:hypothetical protein
MTQQIMVNNFPVSNEAIETEFKRLYRACRKNMSEEELEKQREDLFIQARDMAINRRLLIEEAERRGIEAKESEINSILARSGDQQPEAREIIRRACKVEKLIAAVISSVPRPGNEETMKYLKDTTAIKIADHKNPELMQKLVEKAGGLLYRLRQNQALNDFIADLRKKAVIIGETAFNKAAKRRQL